MYLSINFNNTVDYDDCGAPLIDGFNKDEEVTRQAPVPLDLPSEEKRKKFEARFARIKSILFFFWRK